ncbi:site-specific integrase [Halogeometricum sp. S1BR25-6]|uniref:Site-specific integrase n=1 Tax=Halogeometricum salsisoli TaxID=2950536 RepID=A0ABU2GJ61_9EURY|nr:tyrosine-type recombinase/integrase [Halogeometricum sp. S1BR25-6]MDS0300304.1 site-specific integrase [Halogeometricum sp. S1BR25-6]
MSEPEPQGSNPDEAVSTEGDERAADTSEIDAAIGRYLRASGESAQYSSTAESVLSQFETWLRRRGKDSFAAFEDEGEQLLRRYADRLAQRVEAGGISASSAGTYFNVISGFLSFCVRDGDLLRNPALSNRAREPLPRDDREPDRQFWSPDVRRRLVQYTNDRAYKAIEADGMDAHGEVRDRALVHVIAYTGVRGAEVFRVSGDDREGRQGLTWDRVDTDAWTFRVWGKAQEWEDVSVPKQAREALQRWRTVQNPPSGTWPVFPTSHAPSKYAAARETLGEERANALLEDADVDDVLRDRGIAPPAVTTEGVRRILERVAQATGVDVDGKPPLPHGARRGLGDELYRTDRGLAQDVLRHKSLSTTREAYSYIEAEELGERVGDVLSEDP